MPSFNTQQLIKSYFYWLSFFRLLIIICERSAKILTWKWLVTYSFNKDDLVFSNQINCHHLPSNQVSLIYFQFWTEHQMNINQFLDPDLMRIHNRLRCKIIVFSYVWLGNIIFKIQGEKPPKVMRAKKYLWNKQTNSLRAQSEFGNLWSLFDKLI